MNRLLAMALLANLASPTTLIADLQAQSIAVEKAKKAAKATAAQDPQLQAIQALRKEVEELRKLVEKLAAQKGSLERPNMFARRVAATDTTGPVATRPVFGSYSDADETTTGQMQIELRTEGKQPSIQVVEASPAPQDPGKKPLPKASKSDHGKKTVMILRNQDGGDSGTWTTDPALAEGDVEAIDIARKLKAALDKKEGKRDAAEVETRNGREGGGAADGDASRHAIEVVGDAVLELDGVRIEIQIENDEREHGNENEALGELLDGIRHAIERDFDGVKIDFHVEHDGHGREREREREHEALGELLDKIRSRIERKLVNVENDIRFEGLENSIRRMMQRRPGAGGIQVHVKPTEHDSHGHEGAEGTDERVLHLIEKKLGGRDGARRIHVEILDEGDRPAGGRKIVELGGDRGVLFWKPAPQEAPNQGYGCDACGCDCCQPKPNSSPAHPPLPNKKRGKDAPRPAIRRVLRMDGAGGPPQRILQRVFRADAGGDGPRGYVVLPDEPEDEAAPGKQRIRFRAMPAKPAPGKQPRKPVAPPPMGPKAPVEEKSPKARRVRVIRD